MRIFSTVSRLVAAGALLASAGCLQKQITHTLYLSPAGDVVWSTLEKDVRSDEGDGSRRAAEENQYVASVAGGQHSIAAALAALGGNPLGTTWVRRERPYSVLIEARFAGIRELAEAILWDAGLSGDAAIETAGCETRLTVRVNVTDSGTSEGDTATSALVEELDRYRIVMTEGRFVFADGFVLDGDGVVATPDKGKEPRDGLLTLVLVWSTCPPRRAS